MMSRSVCCVLSCIAVAAGIVSCAGRSDEHAIRIGYLQNDLHHLPLFVALEKNMFEEAGVQVQLAGAFRAGPELMSAFGAGELDVGYVGQAPATAAVLNGVADVRFIAQVNLNGSALVVRAGSSLSSMSDINGALIAIPGHATMQEFLLHTALARHAIDKKAVRIIVLKPPEMIQALSRGGIDGFIAWEPYPSQAVVDGTGRVLASSEDIMDGHPCCVLIASSACITARPKEVKALQTVHEKSCAYIHDNPEEALAIGVRYTGFSRAAVAQALRGIIYTHQYDSASATRFADYLRDLNYIKQRPGGPSAGDLFLPR